MTRYLTLALDALLLAYLLNHFDDWCSLNEVFLELFNKGKFLQGLGIDKLPDSFNLLLSLFLHLLVVLLFPLRKSLFVGGSFLVEELLKDLDLVVHLGKFTVELRVELLLVVGSLGPLFILIIQGFTRARILLKDVCLVRDVRQHYAVVASTQLLVVYLESDVLPRGPVN